MAQQKNKAFTLIELLIVIAIIGLISTLAVTALKNAREKARDTKRKADVQQLMKAMEMCADSQGGVYPDTTGGTGVYSFASLKCLGFGTSEACFNGRFSGFDSLRTCIVSYIKKTIDPSRVNAIFDAYLYSSACHSSHLLPNGGRCIYWQPEGTINDSTCYPGTKGNSGGDVCGYNCNFCALRIGN